ncbi:DUF1772 domain-containing protein [Fodinibius salsisoli]|uniref:DUF1772 domain-containing protein n=1 Tax=Fodinibius salsisoli TaxID=2820877 RepID=A0ABT3PHV7_9BACT|nr:anthrone oxygenase family protein [Fodinibius salsisoli]MCW9705515.1 DUF1772 domain-containing protein [Fodinibius salsisoli]
METIKLIILIGMVTFTGLTAGLFFAWSCSVMPGLSRVPDRVFITAMQSMNRAIQNPLFFSIFFGAALLLPLSSYLFHGVALVFELLVGATIVYWVGVIGVTISGNVPLNNKLESFQLASVSEDDMFKIREGFESRWNRLNHVRTIASTVTLVLTITATLLLH